MYVVGGRVLPSEKKKRGYKYNHVIPWGFVQACTCLCMPRSVQAERENEQGPAFGCWYSMKGRRVEEIFVHDTWKDFLKLSCSQAFYLSIAPTTYGIEKLYKISDPTSLHLKCSYNL